MTGWAAKRFWTDVAIRDEADGFAILLDGRPVNTPLRSPLILPTRALADAVAGEWAAQSGRIDPRVMPMTRSANSAIEKVRPQRAAVVAMLAEYGETDLLCYRAETPEGLVARQQAGWDPLLDWCAEAQGAPLRTGTGVMPIAQPAGSLTRLRGAVDRLDSFALTGFHDLVTLSGSLVIALAVAAERLDPEEGWRLSRIDETWQAEQWGVDDEAEAAAAVKRDAFHHAAAFVALSATKS